MMKNVSKICTVSYIAKYIAISSANISAKYIWQQNYGLLGFAKPSKKIDDCDIISVLIIRRKIGIDQVK